MPPSRALLAAKRYRCLIVSVGEAVAAALGAGEMDRDKVGAGCADGGRRAGLDDGVRTGGRVGRVQVVDVVSADGTVVAVTGSTLSETPPVVVRVTVPAEPPLLWELRV